MAAGPGEIRLQQLCNMLRHSGLFAMTLGMSHFFSPATQEPDSAFAAFLMWILGIWLVMLSFAIPTIPGPGGRRIAAQIVEFIENFVLGAWVDLLF